MCQEKSSDEHNQADRKLEHKVTSRRSNVGTSVKVRRFKAASSTLENGFADPVRSAEHLGRAMRWRRSAGT
jgi:hypothetical protein